MRPRVHAEIHVPVVAPTSRTPNMHAMPIEVSTGMKYLRDISSETPLHSVSRRVTPSPVALFQSSELELGRERTG